MNDYTFRMEKLQIGHRVKHKTDNRDGFVIGTPANELVPIAIEGSTRKEQWPISLVLKKPKKQQLPLFGGTFKPPAGFPLNI